MLTTLLALHLLAAVFWVGGMAFAYFVVRPAAGPLDSPTTRLAFWRRIFAGFLPWVGLSVVVLLASGYTMMSIYFGGFRAAPLYINLMQGLGVLMTLLYLHMFFAPWRRFQEALDENALPEAAKYLNQIRIVVIANLVLGILTVLIGGTGRYW